MWWFSRAAQSECCFEVGALASVHSNAVHCRCKKECSDRVTEGGVREAMHTPTASIRAGGTGTWPTNRLALLCTGNRETSYSQNRVGQRQTWRGNRGEGGA